MDEIKAKQQVVEKIKESGKILVTVSNSPSVDALSAALALTLLLDKQEKYATAIFSGETPPAIAFLEPQKTFDDTTDSLRDFIIALNKEKADHLRYKVVDDAVKIFITPYKTTIDQSDLEFSQGDYNVELVIALGVDNQEHLDKALEDHGQILHDAAIITVTAGDQTSDLGGIDWHDGGASSLSEMVAGLAEALKADKKKSLLDGPIATALLTGIVAQTDRFSNEHTTSKAMTVAATLMSAGADQQIIANELQASHEIPEPVEEPENTDDTSDDDSDVEVDHDSNDGSMTIKKEHDATALAISHEGETLADLDRRVLGDEKAKEKVIGEVELAEEKAAEEEKKEDEGDSPASTPEVKEAVAAPVPTPEATTPSISSAYAAEEIGEEPTLGGTLNATTEQAADDARREIENDQNRTILSHSYIGGAPDAPAPVSNGALQDTPQGFPGTPSVAPGSQGVNDMPTGEVHSAYAFDDAPVNTDPQPTPAVGGERVIKPLNDITTEPTPAFAPAPTSVYAAPEVAPAPVYAAPAPAPAPIQAPVADATPAELGLPLPPPIPDFSQVNGAPAPAIPLPPTQQPEILGDILAPEPQQAPSAPFAPLPEQPAPQNNPADPGQFQIPTQQ